MVNGCGNKGVKRAPHYAVNTFGLPPVPLEFVVSIRLVARELLRTLFDDLRAVCWCNRHCTENIYCVLRRMLYITNDEIVVEEILFTKVAEGNKE